MIIIGHRGARGLAPENTISGFNKALEYSVDEIEFDLRVTKDSAVILHHDRDIIDPNGIHRRISRHTYRELLDHKKDLVTFEEALHFLYKKVPLYIEIKPGVPTEQIIKIIHKAIEKGWDHKDLRIASFSFPILQEMNQKLPEIQLIINETWSGVRASHRASKLGITRVSMSQLWLWSGFIKAVSRGNIQLTTYTLNNPKKAKKWEKYGLYGVVTDFPDRYNHKSSD